MKAIRLANRETAVEFVIDDSGRVALATMERLGASLRGSSLPLVEVLTVGTGTGVIGRLDSTVVGTGMRYRSHEEGVSGTGPWVSFELVDSQTGIVALVSFELFDETAALRITTTVENRSHRAHQLLAVSSLALASADWSAHETEIHHARCSWLAENRWTSATLHRLGEPRIDSEVHEGHRQRSSFSVGSRGTWSTGESLPMGGLEAPDGVTVLWQIESNGAWSWRVAQTSEGMSVIAAGPTDRESGWLWRLEPGGSYQAPRVAVVLSNSGFAAALADLTRYRRVTRRSSPTGWTAPIVYNDYMNTIMADPTTEKLLPLIAAAGSVGADVYCIDAGWYADEPGWWDSVGAWEPSSTRFPGGLDEVINAIRAEGMTPGIWLEPEVVGVRSPIAATLPDEAYFLRAGERVVIDGRYHLDLRHPAARARLDEVIDGLITRFGVGYFKFDYNVCAIQGTDVSASSPGTGQQLAAAAFLDWVDRLLDRHPALIVEACASGGMRSDWATMSRFALLSTSDQQDALASVPIAASAATVVPPEQAGVWCYPQPGLSEREWSVALVNGLLSRPYLSGFIDKMTPEERARITDFLGTYRRISGLIDQADPYWPLGLPGWEDEWVAFGLLCADGGLLLSVWHRGGASARAEIPLPSSLLTEIQPLYPAHLEEARYAMSASVLEITLPPDSAMSFRLRPATVTS